MLQDNYLIKGINKQGALVWWEITTKVCGEQWKGEGSCLSLNQLSIVNKFEFREKDVLGCLVLNT